MSSWLKLVFEVAYRNLLARRLTVVIGIILLATAAFIVVGGSVVLAINRAIGGAVAESVAGDLQIYSAESRDDLDLFAAGSNDPLQLEPMDDFAPVERLLREDPAVTAVVPMGSHAGYLSAETVLDQVLERLRSTYRQGDATKPLSSPEALKQHVRKILEILQADLTAGSALFRRDSVAHAELVADLARARSDAFWAGFDADPEGNLEFLENRIAPLMGSGEPLTLAFVGADPVAYAKAFPRFELVEGEALPEGQRGILLNQRTYQQTFKIPTARRLDQMQAAIKEGRTIAEDEELQRWARENQTQTRALFLQLDPERAEVATRLLRQELGNVEGDLQTLLKTFLTLDDSNFERRRAFFFGPLSEVFDLHTARVGSVLTVRSFTGTGQIESENLRVYGIFKFRGLEGSEAAGTLNFVDLVSFRALYGHLPPAAREETQRMMEAAGVQSMTREQVEAELAAGDSSVESSVPTSFDEDALFADFAPERDVSTYTPAEMKSGMALSLAVLVDDHADREAVAARLQEKLTAAGHKLRVVPWEESSGLLGNMAVLTQAILWIAVCLMFLVIAVVANNALVMATLGRSGELGTMRAVGAQSGEVFAMVVTEGALLGAAAGAVGAVLGGALVLALQGGGIQSGGELTAFLFSGPVLYPQFSQGQLVVAFLTVLGLSVFAALYPARLAMRVSPLKAMQTEE